MLRADPSGGRSTRWLDRGLVAAGLLVLTIGYRVVVEGSDWWITTVLVTLVAVLTCGVLRALGVRLVAPIAAVVLFVTIAWVFVPGTLAAGFPTPDTVGALADLVGDARRVIIEEQAPVAAARGIVLLVAVAFGSLVVVADAFLELRRASAWIGLLLLGVFAVPAMVSGRTPSFWLFVVAAVPWLVLMRDRATTTRRSRDLDVQTPAVVIGVAALVCALLLPAFAPDIRAAAAAWGEPPPSVFGRGINPMLELGQNLRRNSTAVALTYKTTADEPLYLKVATLRDFTGRTWRPGGSLPQDRFEGNLGLDPGIEPTTDTTRVTIRGLESPLLPVPYIAQETAGLEGAWRYERMGMTVRSESADTSGQTYTVRSLTITPTAEQMRALGPTVIGPSLEPFVSLPADVPQSIVDTARDVTASAPTDYDRALALQEFLRNGDFTYSETAPVADDYDGNGLDVVATFLDRKAGYCVHFASAMAVMARTIDIPSRIAVGYAPGRATGLDDGESVYENTSNDLHAWTELFFEGVGWVRFDPTTSIGSATVFQEPDTTTSEEPTDESSSQASGQQRNEATGPNGDTGTSGGTAPRTVVVTGSVVLLVLVAPGIGRELRRRRRLASPSPVPWWHEVQDTALDLGLDVPQTDTPRGFAARLAEHPDIDPDALARLLHRVEVARFARASTELEPGGAEDARTLIGSLRAGSPPSARWRARLLPRSLGPQPATSRRPDADALVHV